MSRTQPRRFSRDFKLEAIERLRAGESGTALALELSVKRTILYRWWSAFQLGGVEALRSGPGRPAKHEAAAMRRARAVAAEAYDLAGARRGIARLQRKLGRQQRELDQVKQALRNIGGGGRPSGGGAPPDATDVPNISLSTPEVISGFVCRYK